MKQDEAGLSYEELIANDRNIPKPGPGGGSWRAMGNPPKRDRGRPPSENLGRFFVATHLLAHPKLLKLRRELALTDKEAFLLVVRLFDYVATFAGVSAHIPRRDYEALAAWCWFDGDPALLVSAFRRAGFLDNEGDLHDWGEFQPGAKKRSSRRIERSVEPPESPIYGGHNSGSEGTKEPEVILANNGGHNSPEHKNKSLAEPENLAPNLLSQRERERELQELALTRARTSKPGRDEKLAGKSLKQIAQNLSLETKQDSKLASLGDLAPTAHKALQWARIENPTPGDLANLRLAAAQIGAAGIERLVADFTERQYEPANRLAALLAAARDEFKSQPETNTKSNAQPAARDSGRANETEDK